MERGEAKDYHVYFNCPGSFYYEGEIMATPNLHEQVDMAAAIRAVTKKLSDLLKNASENGYDVSMNVFSNEGNRTVGECSSLSIHGITYTEDL